MTAHAKLSASGCYRWSVCTKAPSLEAEFPEETSSYAEEGTLAHALGEHCLINEIATADAEGAYPQEMRDYIQGYVDYVQSLGALRYIEQRVDFSPWVPEGFGTADAIVIVGDTLKICDLKYGAGKKVDADNVQGRLYALGTINDYSFLCEDIKTVELHIYQPRLDNISMHSISMEELRAWGEYIKPIAQTAWDGSGEFKPGAHCDFCKARHSCRARKDLNLSVAKLEFGEPLIPPSYLTSDEITQLLPMLDELKTWASDVQAYALATAMKGKPPRGYKVVAGKSNRKWGDEAAVVELLRSDGIEEDELYTKKLLGITGVEKLVGKKHPVFQLAIKPQGAPTLVPVVDERPEYSGAASDFSDSI